MTKNLSWTIDIAKVEFDFLRELLLMGLLQMSLPLLLYPGFNFGEIVSTQSLFAFVLFHLFCFCVYLLLFPSLLSLPFICPCCHVKFFFHCHLCCSLSLSLFLSLLSLCLFFFFGSVYSLYLSFSLFYLCFYVTSLPLFPIFLFKCYLFSLSF